MSYLKIIFVVSVCLCLTLGAGQAFGKEARADVALPHLQVPVHQRLVQLAQDNPTGFLELVLSEYHNRVKDYTCTFVKQELVQGKMTKEQVIDVKFKEDQFSVFMRWVKNPALVAKVLYVKENNDNKVLIKPAGILGWLVPTHVKRPVNGPDAKRASRRNLDQFGFANTLELILSVNRKATQAGELEFGYKGTGSTEGRPTWVFQRRLPGKPDYPDQRMVLHIDQEWLVPTATYSYNGKGKLLGKYMYRDVKFNVGLKDRDFQAKTNGL